MPVYSSALYTSTSFSRELKKIINKRYLHCLRSGKIVRSPRLQSGKWPRARSSYRKAHSALLWLVAFWASRWKLLGSLHLVFTNFFCNKKGLFYLSCTCSEAAAVFRELCAGSLSACRSCGDAVPGCCTAVGGGPGEYTRTACPWPHDIFLQLSLPVCARPWPVLACVGGWYARKGSMPTCARSSHALCVRVCAWAALLESLRGHLLLEYGAELLELSRVTSCWTGKFEGLLFPRSISDPRRLILT